MTKSKSTKKTRIGRPPIDNPADEFIQLRTTAKRKAAYTSAAKPGKLTEWCFKHLDKAAGFKPES